MSCKRNWTAWLAFFATFRYSNYTLLIVSPSAIWRPFKGRIPKIWIVRRRMELRIRSLFQLEVAIELLLGGTVTGIWLFLCHPCNMQISSVFWASLFSDEDVLGICYLLFLFKVNVSIPLPPNTYPPFILSWLEVDLKTENLHLVSLWVSPLKAGIDLRVYKRLSKVNNFFKRNSGAQRKELLWFHSPANTLTASRNAVVGSKQFPHLSLDKLNTNQPQIT